MLSPKKILLGLAPLAAVLAFALVPAIAQAAPEWLVCSEVAGTGKFANHGCKEEGGTKNFEWLTVGAKAAKVEVLTHSTALTLLVPGLEIACEVKDKGFIWNPGGGVAGEDEITEFTNTNCKAVPTAGCAAPVVVTALRKGAVLGAANAWPSLLETAGGVTRDRISEIEIDVTCNGVAAGTFTGALTPKINEANGTAEFGAGSGELEEKASGTKAGVDGSDLVEQTNGWAVTAP